MEHSPEPRETISRFEKLLVDLARRVEPNRQSKAERMASKRFLPELTVTGWLAFSSASSTSSGGSSWRNCEGWQGSIWPYFLRAAQWLMVRVCMARVIAT